MSAIIAIPFSENRFIVARGKGHNGREDWGLGLTDANYYK